MNTATTDLTPTAADHEVCTARLWVDAYGTVTEVRNCADEVVDGGCFTNRTAPMGAWERVELLAALLEDAWQRLTAPVTDAPTARKWGAADAFTVSVRRRCEWGCTICE